MDSPPSDRLDALLQGVGDDWGLLSSHVEDYTHTTRECGKRLCRIWEDTGMSRSEQERELADVTEAISRVWGNAVDRAESQQAHLRRRLDDAVKQICEIRAELGEDDASCAEGVRSVESLLGGDARPGWTLRMRYNAALELLTEWETAREEKFAEFQKLTKELGRLRARLGHSSPSPVHDRAGFSLNVMKHLKHEIEMCTADKQRREMELEAVLSHLRKICIELGEDDVAIAESAHPSLRYYREALPGQFHTQFRRHHASNDFRSDLRPEDIELDLSDATFSALECAIEDTKQMKPVREQQASELSEVLHNLWKVLKVEEDDIDRGIHKRLLEGPTRLHSKSIDKCMAEVTRLEKAKAALLQDLIDERIQELALLCENTHLEMPDLTPLLPAEGGDGQVASVGLVSDALGKLIRMVEEVAELGVKREGIISMLLELEASKGEVCWLIAYEQDEGRYKGRDCNRNLQKALKVGKIRDKMPAMVENLREALMMWEQTQGCPFIFDGVNYKESLEAFAQQLEASTAAKRAARTSKNGQSKRTKASYGSQQLSQGNGTNRSMGRSVSRASTVTPSGDYSPDRLKLGSMNPRAGSLQLSYRSSRTLTSAHSVDLDVKNLRRRNHNPLQEKVNSVMQTVHSGKMTRQSVEYHPSDNGDNPPDPDIMSSGDWTSSRQTPMRASDIIMASGDWKVGNGRGMYGSIGGYDPDVQNGGENRRVSKPGIPVSRIRHRTMRG
ncbi:hypothetical protein BSKO_06715 [Bryopsis sp. KO-2023]|nr:hypothetical protein BSKO_06715 [Bryopsis sp. KO-2023]